VKGLGRRAAEPAGDEVARLREQVKLLRGRNRRLRDQVARLKERGEGATTAVPEIEGRSRIDVRRDCVFASASRDASVLEIGPAHNAILPKREGFATRTVDYLDREGLVEQYRGFAHYSPDDIEEVDYVLAPGSAMADVIPERFDVVLASHVIEHTTSMVDFLNECTRLLAPGGVVALVVPDHRYCLDRFRERASLGRVIDASLASPAVHTVGTVTEALLDSVRRGESTSWRPGNTSRFGFVHEHETVVGYAEQARAAQAYLDVHNWVCSPHHLRLLLHDLADLGYVSVRETFFHDTVGHEFFLNLSVDGPGPGLGRAELVALAEDERRSVDRPRFRRPDGADGSVAEAPLVAGLDGDLH
jgi:SAM-dependent methyltransferase